MPKFDELNLYLNAEFETGFDQLVFDAGNSEKKPCLILSMKNNEKNQEYLSKHKNSLAPFQDISTDEKIIIKFEKTRAVLYALASIYLNPTRYENYHDVKSFIKVLQRRSENKPGAKPHKFIDINTLTQMDQSNDSSSSPPPLLEKRMVKVSDELFIYFQKAKNLCTKNPQFEACACELHRFFMGVNRVPESFSVYKDSKRKGVAVTEIENFVSFYEYIDIEENKNISPTKFINQVIELGLVPMLVAAYVFEEFDLHGNNWGFIVDHDNIEEIVRIDFDLTLASFTGELHNLSLGPYKLGKHFINPKTAFPIHADDVDTFPFLKHMTPFNWVVERKKIGEKRDSQWKYIKEIINHPKFEKLKWKYFLKAILMPMESLKTIIQQDIAATPTQTKLFNHLQNRISCLSKVLIKNKNFCRYLIQYGDEYLQDLLNEFKQYNDSNSSHVLVNPEQVIQKYQEIKNLVPCNQLTGRKSLQPHSFWDQNTFIEPEASSSNKRSKPQPNTL